MLKVMTMSDDKTKQKAMEAAADIYGIFNTNISLFSLKFSRKNQNLMRAIVFSGSFLFQFLSEL